MDEKHTNPSGKKAKWGIKDIAKAVIHQISADNLAIIAAGMAFFFFLSIFPAIIAMISLYGLIVDPQEAHQQMSQLSSFLPEQVQHLIQKQSSRVSSMSGSRLSWGVILSILIGLWSSHKGIRAMFKAIDIAYDIENNRNFFKKNGLALLFTLIGVVLVIIILAVIVVFPSLSNHLDLHGIMNAILSWGRWVILGFIIVFYIGAIYKFGPARDYHGHKWLSPGAFVATILWLLASWGFSLFINNVSNFNRIYGSLAAIIILMLWFFLSGFIILLGAEINEQVVEKA